MIPEFSYCECDNPVYTNGLYSSRGGVVYTSKDSVLEVALEFWFEEWATYPFAYSEATKLLIPGGLI